MVLRFRTFGVWGLEPKDSINPHLEGPVYNSHILWDPHDNLPFLEENGSYAYMAAATTGGCSLGYPKYFMPNYDREGQEFA